ncbi:enoyl-CoA hydratase-related protein [Maricaulis sp.]|uniref:enoyl-CoA hydratase-related protein n=1 Tax=Maricaulis sp. TaxID=1486257 RepID=UPI003A932D7F
MSDAVVLLDVSPAGVAVVTINRPEKHNAFNAEVIAALSEIFETLRANPGNVRMVLLRGAGPSFSAGADLEWMQSAAHFDEIDNEQDAMALATMLKRLYDLPQMTVALVQGAAMGGGAGLLAACDVGVVMADAKIRFSEVRLGLTPATISPYVIRAIGPKWARALFVSGESFDGNFAYHMGLAQYVVANMEEMTQMEEHLAKLAFATAPGAVADAKQLVDDVAGREIDHGLAVHTAKAIAKRRVSEEGREGLVAFLERRKPSWAE